MDIVKRFLKYVSIETTSIEESETRPSNPLEYNLLNYLKDELINLGVDAFIKDGFVYAKIKSDINKKDTIFLMAHVDTSPDASGKDIKPRIVHYDGSPIQLNKDKVLSRDKFTNLDNHLDHDLIVTDGTTLLGADEFDVDWALKNENKIYAYTVDGGDIRGFSYENFNASSAKVTINGVSVHPGSAKGKMINSLEVIQEFHNLLPKCRPENTELKEGFIHLTNLSGQTEKSISHYILRSFFKDELEGFKDSFIKAQEIINNKYGQNTCLVSINDQYSNMKEVIDKYPHSVDLVHQVYKEMNILCIDEPIRGGTDGARLSFMGLPCPNLGDGGENFHGVYEYLDINQMKMMSDIIINMMDKIE